MRNVIYQKRLKSEKEGYLQYPPTVFVTREENCHAIWFENEKYSVILLHGSSGKMIERGVELGKKTEKEMINFVVALQEICRKIERSLENKGGD